MFLDGNRQHAAVMLGVIAGEIFFLPCSIETLTLYWSRCHLLLIWCIISKLLLVMNIPNRLLSWR
jgi:hypothetical protein